MLKATWTHGHSFMQHHAEKIIILQDYIFHDHTISCDYIYIYETFERRKKCVLTKI